MRRLWMRVRRRRLRSRSWIVRAAVLFLGNPDIEYTPNEITTRVVGE